LRAVWLLKTPLLFLRRGRPGGGCILAVRRFKIKQLTYIYSAKTSCMPQLIHNRKPIEKFRKALRHNLTPAEAVLWKAIQRGKLDGRKFRRQHSVGSYVLDFYCPAELLAVELDGAHHFTLAGNEYDVERTKYLNALNIRVLRFENKFVFSQLDGLLDEIKAHFGKNAGTP
jgi:very-short-patch-repair endonuclease